MKNRLTTFLQRITGLDTSHVERTSDHFQQQVTTQGIIMLLTPLFAASLAAYGVYSTFGNLSIALLVGCCIYPLVYLVERVTTSSLEPPSWANWALRIGLFFAVVGIHVFSTDLIVFDKEIQHEAEQMHFAKQSIGVAALDSLISIGNARLDRHQQRIDSVRGVMKQHLAILDGEADGTSGSGKTGVDRITKFKEAGYNQMLAENYHPAIRDYELRKQADSLLLAPVIFQRDSILHQTPFDYESVGMGERLSILHKLAWREGGQPILWLMIVIILLAAVSDFLPIITRHLMDFDQYLTYHDLAMKEEEKRRSVNFKISVAEEQQREDADLHRLTLETEVMLATQALNKRSMHVEKSAEKIVEIYEVQLRAVQLLQQLHSEAFTTLNTEEQNVIHTAYLDALEQLEQITKARPAATQEDPVPLGYSPSEEAEK